MSSSKRSDDEKRFIDAVLYGQLEEVIELSNKFSNDVKVLSNALIRSCIRGPLHVVKWLIEHTAADVNYKNKERPFNTPLTVACAYDHLDIVKYLVETCHADVNLPEKKKVTHH